MNNKQFKIGDTIVWGNPGYIEHNGIVRAISRDGMTLYVKQDYPDTRTKLVDVPVMQARRPRYRYYFKVEKLQMNAVTFSYVYRDGDDAASSPPVVNFHSMADNADEVVSNQAIDWIRQHGELVIVSDAA